MVDKTTEELVQRHLFERPLPYCPWCESMDLVPIRRDDDVDFLCRRCAGSWHVELGAFWRVESPPQHVNERVTTNT
jgi:hypothetical protein